MKEIHGVADAHQKFVGGPKRIAVRVEDGDGEVILRIGTEYACLTPTAARFIAAKLIKSAERVSPRVVVVPKGQCP
jgi:hypothetical protein